MDQYDYQTQPNQRWWDIPAAVILLGTVFSATLRLASTRWVDELPLIHVIALVGVVAGLAIGYSRFSSKVSSLLILFYGVFMIGWRFGEAYTAGQLWLDRVENLVGRVGTSVSALIQMEPVTDPMMFVLGMAVGFWILGTGAGISLTRYANTWWAILPTGIVLFVIHYFDRYFPERSWTLGAFIFLGLVLLARMHFVQMHSRWQATRTHLPPYVGIDLLRTTLVAALLILVLAWSAPAMAATIPPVQQAWQVVARPYYEARDRFSNAFAALNSPVRVAQDVFGNSLSLGLGSELGDAVALTVTAPPKSNPGVRYYWRARTYSRYANNTWFDMETLNERVGEDDITLPVNNTNLRTNATFIVSPNNLEFTLYSINETIGVNRPANAYYIENTDGSLDILGLQARQAVVPGESYEIRARVANATIADLRAAGIDYPDWVRARYLQLPGSITPRTRELALQLAEGQESVYDIVANVTNHLRATIQYQEQIDAPPSGQDVVDWFLFDYQKGFCNYYATAQIMLLRSLGIPARMVVGYAQGQSDPRGTVYTVTERERHAWPEVYFPGIGWVEFEPTVSQQPIQRLSGEPATPPDSTNNPDPEQEERDLLSELLEEEAIPTSTPAPEDLGAGETTSAPPPPSNTPPWATVFALLAGVPTGLAILFMLYRSNQTRVRKLLTQQITPIPILIERLFIKAGIRAPRFIQRWAYRAALPGTVKAYEQINRSLAYLGSEAPAHFTPSERALLLNRILPQAGDAIETLVFHYQQLIYGNIQINDDAAISASRNLRRQTWEAYLRRRFSFRTS